MTSNLLFLLVSSQCSRLHSVPEETDLTISDPNVLRPYYALRNKWDHTNICTEMSRIHHPYLLKRPFQRLQTLPRATTTLVVYGRSYKFMNMTAQAVAVALYDGLPCFMKNSRLSILLWTQGTLCLWKPLICWDLEAQIYSSRPCSLSLSPALSTETFCLGLSLVPNVWQCTLSQVSYSPSLHLIGEGESPTLGLGRWQNRHHPTMARWDGKHINSPTYSQPEENTPCHRPRGACNRKQSKQQGLGVAGFVVSRLPSVPWLYGGMWLACWGDSISQQGTTRG